MSESRIQLLNNGATPKQKAKVASHNATIGELNDALAAERIENEKMVRFYLEQVPELVARMIADCLKANGLQMLPPQSVWDAHRPPAGHTAEIVTDTPPAQHAAEAPDNTPAA